MKDRVRAAFAAFLFRGDSDRWFSCLRIGIASVSILYAISLRWEWNDLFLAGRRGILNRELAETILSLESASIPRLGWIVAVGDRIGLSEAATVGATWWILLLGGIFLLLGLFSREAACLVAFLHLATVKSVASLTYGLDNFTTIGLFYIAIGPLPDRLALDFLWRKRGLPTAEWTGFFRRVLQLHLTIAYLFGGIAKCAGPGWWDGSSLWRALIRPPFNQVSPQLVLSFSALLPVLGIVACLLETTYPVLIWPPRTRRVWLAAIILMHVGIGLAFGLYLFALVMIVLNVAAFAPWSLRSDSVPGHLLSTAKIESATLVE